MKRTVLLKPLKIKLDTNLKIILFEHQNNYMKLYRSVDDNAGKNFNILAISLNILFNYFDGPNKIIFTSTF